MEVTEVPRAIIALLPSPRAWKGTVHTEGLRQTLRHLVGWQGSAAEMQSAGSPCSPVTTHFFSH